MSATSPVAENPAAPPQPERTNPLVFAVLLAVCALGGVLAVTRLGSNTNETFSFVGSSIKPSVGGDNPAGRPADGGAARGVPAPRKIIYTATLEITVADVDAAVGEVRSLLAAQKGHVARSEVRADSAARRDATFTLRVPADNLRPLLDGLARLSTPVRNALDSSDVTEEFVDVEARVKNLTQEEETLNRLLKEKAGNVEEVLAVRRQLQPVRESIDRALARHKYLSEMTALSTVNLTLREAKDAPAPETFAAQVGSTFSGSWDSLVKFGKKLTLAGVAVTAWGPLLAAGGVGLLVVRRVSRGRGTPTPPPSGGSGPA